MMKYPNYTWDLALGLESASPDSYKTPAKFIDSICPINQKKANNLEIRFNSQQIVSYCLGIGKQNPVLIEVVARSTC